MRNFRPFVIPAGTGMAFHTARKAKEEMDESERRAIAIQEAEELAAEMLATTLGVEFDPDRSWDEKKEVYRLSNKIVRTTNTTQSAIGDKAGLWTTTIAAAILIFE